MFLLNNFITFFMFQQSSVPNNDQLYNTRLIIKGSGVVSFTNETTLNYVGGSSSSYPHILIQTDKAAYKTGQKGMFIIISASLWENRSSGFPTRSDTNRAVQLLKMAIGLKFRI